MPVAAAKFKIPLLALKVPIAATGGPNPANF
jgi:hypothetical protein